MLTRFGVALRKMRLDRQLRLGDLADRLSLTSSFVSAIETGRRPIPRGYIEDVSTALSLTVKEIEELRCASDEERTTIFVDTLEAKDKVLVASFARRIKSLSPETLEYIRRLLNDDAEPLAIESRARTAWNRRTMRSENPVPRQGRVRDEIPFDYDGVHIRVAPMSISAISGLVDLIRDAFFEPHTVNVSICLLLEIVFPLVFPRFHIEICESQKLGPAASRMISGGGCIIIPEDVYDAARHGNPYARFILCHELGHALLHHHRTIAEYWREPDPIYTDSEWQSDTFASLFLFYRKHRSQFRTRDEAAEVCGLPLGVTAKRWRYLELNPWTTR